MKVCVLLNPCVKVLILNVILFRGGGLSEVNKVEGNALMMELGLLWEKAREFSVPSAMWGHSKRMSDIPYRLKTNASGGVNNVKSSTSLYQEPSASLQTLQFSVQTPPDTAVAYWEWYTQVAVRLPPEIGWSELSVRPCPKELSYICFLLLLYQITPNLMVKRTHIYIIPFCSLEVQQLLKSNCYQACVPWGLLGRTYVFNYPQPRYGLCAFNGKSFLPFFYSHISIWPQAGSTHYLLSSFKIPCDSIGATVVT